MLNKHEHQLIEIIRLNNNSFMKKVLRKAMLHMSSQRKMKTELAIKEDGIFEEIFFK